MLITGDVGTGKTTLLNLLLKNLPKYTRTAFISNPKLNINEFFYLISKSFNLGDIVDKAQFLVKIGSFLQEAKRNQENIILIVDEAHCLSEELLEEIRLLSNLETPEGKLMNIILVGQTEIKDLLKKDSMRALNQRITLRYHLRPLTEEETREYIQVRLMKAGAKDIDIFSKGALEAIYKYTGGIPRIINVLADKALLTGFVRETPKIDDEIIRECAQEMDLTIEDNDGQSASSKSERDNAYGVIKIFLKLIAVMAILLLIIFMCWALSGSEVPSFLSFLSRLFD